ncbi:EAL domain-containing protein [Chitinivorax sp. PXF-14]|uniref:EAL domain-containing response regulator n=1 Tax=Chitinivorax sp. PXF-14 TaxID=3230488 RepID=UPI0034663D9F
MSDTPQHDHLEFAEELEPPQADNRPHWLVLIVDDDKEVHQVTTFALRDAIILQRRLTFLHAYSAAEAQRLLASHQDIAVVLLDVVMEKEDAGLNLVRVIREELKLSEVRIVLRTGQPGYAPELSAIRDYDINDYKTKSELTLTRLMTTMTTAIRSYDQLRTIAAGRRGLDLIVHAAPDMFARHRLDGFADAVLQHLIKLLGSSGNGLACIQMGSEPCYVAAAVGTFASITGYPLCALQDAAAHSRIEHSLHTGTHQDSPGALTLYFRTRAAVSLVLDVPTATHLGGVDRQLLEVFGTNISVGLESVGLLQQLNQFAFSDTLCHLPNRARLVQLIDELRASGERGYTLALVDIDHFSEFNDALGHENGDLLLRAVSERLRQGLPPQATLARVTGDTFGILAPDAEIAPERMLGLFDRPFTVNQYSLRVRGTIGLVRLGIIDGSGLTAHKCASIALNRAKNDQRGRFCYYTEQMEQDTQRRLIMLHDLREAIEAQRLQLHYQPQVNLATGEPLGAEALLRWPTANGFIPPDQFIPLAEYSGLIIELGTWVLRTACHEVLRWQAQGHADLRIAVNVSMVQFQNPDFVATVDTVLRETGIPPGNLELEITESVAMLGAVAMENTLRMLKALGVTVAIDDFGTGFSSLSYLQRLPIDRLKIDRAFVRELGKGTRTSIADMIVQLGQELGLTVIAEGVETTEQQAELNKLGCQEGQGYLFGKPQPGADFLAWLARAKA